MRDFLTKAPKFLWKTFCVVVITAGVISGALFKKRKYIYRNSVVVPLHTPLEDMYRTLQHRKDTDRRPVDYNYLIRYYPQSPDGYYARAHVKLSYNNYDGCAEDMTTAIRLLPDTGYIKRGDYTRFLADVQQQAGKQTEAMKDCKAAIKYYDQALKLDPAQPSAARGKSAAREKIKQYRMGISKPKEAGLRKDS